MGLALVTLLTNFVNVLLASWCLEDVIPVFFGGSLIALKKKSGVVRPIDIGYTFRKITAKCANNCAL